uniref:Uncharacterized protein n=1 Tax=Avena sativa TaxID=4498 RepID=A0ACD5YPS8_AVESA
MPGVLYKRSPPPPEPEDDPYPRSPTSPSYECPEFETMPDYIPDERGPTTHFSGDGDDQDLELDIPTNPEPKDDDSYPRRPTSLSYECPGFETMDDYTPDELGLSTHLSTDADRDIPMYGIADNFDSLYNDGNTFSKEDLERQTNKYVTAALGHYNSQEKNTIKYELIKAITSTAIMDGWRLYGHVNFTAKSSLENSKEEFFFAELCSVPDDDIYVPTCIISLEEKERIGGVRGIKGNDGYYGNEIRVDTRHCYACEGELMHPKDGALYEIGHHVDDYYGYCCN